MCLCKFHDAVFEDGYSSLDDQLSVVTRANIESDTIQALLGANVAFHRPAEFASEVEFLGDHRSKHGLMSLAGYGKSRGEN